MKVGKFPEQLTVNVWMAESPLVFGTAAKLGEWAQAQMEAWAAISKPTTNAWAGPLAEQVSHFDAVSVAANRYRQNIEGVSDESQLRDYWISLQNDINGVLNNITNGRTLTTDAPLFSQIETISKVEPDAAMLLYLSQRSDWDPQIQHVQQYGSKFYRGLIRLAGMNGSAEVNPAVSAKEIASLKNQLRQDSETFSQNMDEWSGRYEQFSSGASKADDDRATAWQEELEGVRSDWTSLKKTYDEQLALQAPTQYWKDREKNSRFYAVAFGIAFLAVAASCLLVFVLLGIPYLHGVATMKDTNVLVLALPVLIPGFIAIWLLRILGRLFAENLQLSIDAGERQTMVKTFLALMHDEERGKALVTDSDRILILHSLFRPSAVSSADDAPPVHWFDILSQKLGGPKK